MRLLEKCFFREQTSGTTTGNVWSVAGSTTEKFVISVNGQTGAVTVPVGSGTTLAAGSGMTLSAIVADVGHTIGIDPTATIHVAGISADGGITASGNIKTAGRLVADVVQSEDNVNSRYGFETNDSIFSVYTGNNDPRARIDSNGIHAENGRIKANTFVEAGTYVHVGTGISLDAGGITFPDGTFQSSAASGSTITAGAGMTLAGSTLGIDPTAVVHVAGISSDGGISAGGDIATSNSARVKSTSGSQVHLKNGEVHIMGTQSSSGAFKVTPTKHTATQVLVAEKGISLDAGGITFPDGTFQSTAPTGSTITAGAGMTLAGSTLGIDPTAIVHVAGVSSDGGITVGGMNIGGVSERLVSSTDVDDFVNFGPNKFEVYQNNARMFKADGTRTYIGSNSSPKDLYVYGELRGYSVINAQAGISMDAAGITFPDGTFQSTAASAGGGGITQSIGFILDGSGAPLTTGEKLDALKQVPYGSSVLSTAAYIQDGVSGTDKTIAFSIKKASTLSSVVSGTTLEIGATASADQTGFTFDGIGGGD